MSRIQSLTARAPGASHRAWIAAAVLVGLLAFVHARTLQALWTVWTTNDNYSHGPLVPLVAAAMVWSRRAALRAAARRPDARGLAVLAAGCALEVLGVRADVLTFQGYALLVMLFGLALTFLGRATTRILAFPIAFLVFMLTFPPLVVNQLSFALKEVAMRSSAWAAEHMGANFQRNGMILQLESGVLRVENPCSGLRSLLALLATGAAFAYFQPGAWWRRGLMVVLAVPLALAANAVRLTLLILVANYVSVRAATGTFHDVTGYLVYLVALAGLIGARTLLIGRGAAEAPAAPGANQRFEDEARSHRAGGAP